MISPFHQPRAPPYPLPYSTNYLSIPLRYPFSPYNIAPSALPTSPFPYYTPNLFSPLSLPAQLPYLPYTNTILQNLSQLDIKNTKPMSLVVLPSSPVEKGSLSDYVKWHISRDLDNKTQYLSALNILQSKYYDLQTIQG